MKPMDNAKNNNLSSLKEIDRLVHEPARLAIMALLYVVESADFTFLMNQTGLSWGNLSTHMSKLEEAGYIEVEKSFKGKRPNTNLRLTPAGRQAFRDYRQKMQQMLNDLPD
jgi:DNA-binding MarR family transcriptional regulator